METSASWDNLQRIQDDISALKLDDSLLFLNHILGVSRGYTSDSRLQSVIQNISPPILPHTVHFLAKQILLHSSALGIRTLDWQQYCVLANRCFELDDPIQHDPDWKGADPSGFFERILSQQIGPQQRNMLQKYGLALGLFRDVGVVEWPQRYDLRSDIQSELGVTVDTFMSMGHLTFAFRTAKCHGNECIGTFTPMTFVEAFRQGITWCEPEVWEPFLQRVACNRDLFREVAAQAEYQVGDPSALERLKVPSDANLYDQFGFNPLWRFPIIDLGNARYLAVDPELIVERVTFGLFYDLFERDRTSFSTRFGDVFERFVGQLIGAVCPTDRLWSASIWEQHFGMIERKRPKMGDWAYCGDARTVLVECKSLRPSLLLRTYGAEVTMKATAERIASAVEQLTTHSKSIAEGKWTDVGLRNRPTVGVIVSYGRLHTANGPFTRARVAQALERKGISPIPYVVLSLDELDTVLCLVEGGKPFDGLIQSLCSGDGSFNPLAPYRSELLACSMSSVTKARGQQFLDGLVSDARSLKSRRI